MRNIFVQLQVQQVTLPPNLADFDHIDVTLTDSTGTDSTQVLNGSESIPWRAFFNNVPEGLARVKAQAMSAAGEPLGPPLSAAQDIPAVKTFPQPVGITINLA